MSSQRTNSKGITLISLVVTIVVLLILAGITIGTVFSDNGIIKKAQEAANATEGAAKKDQDAINGLLNEMDGIINGIGGGSTPIIGDITGKLTWSTGSASLTLTTNAEGVTIQYRKNSDSNWTDYTSPIPSLLHGDKVYVKGIKDGETVISEKEIQVLDTIAPTVTIANSSSTTNSISATATATDNEAGMGASPQYSFYIKKTEEADSAYVQIASSTNASVTKGDLEQNTSYTIKVEVADVAGNKGQATKEVTTGKIAYVDTLKEGDYVKYVDGKNKQRNCVVLYDSSSNYGIEIIAMDTVENIEIGNGTGNTSRISGSSYFNIAKTSYNDAISTLNSKANAYNNSIYSNKARCVGSVPDSPNSESGMLTSKYSYMTNYNGILKDKDYNYLKDYNKISDLGIEDIDKEYWLASRCPVSNSGNSVFGLRIVDVNGEVSDYSSVCEVFNPDASIQPSEGGPLLSRSYKYGLRPVFHLKSTVKLTGGMGTEKDPYTLGI